MRTKYLPVGIVLSGALIATAVFASSPFDIEFPVPELGDCADKTACKAYCEKDEHLDACQAFAEKHGFANKDEADERVRQIEEDGGPGGCARDAKNPVLACKRYCDVTVHLAECVAYAREEGLMDDEELEEAEKVLDALERGVKLPPQCDNATSCKEVCDDPKDLKTARACFEFAKEADLLPEDVSVEQAEKAFAVLESGTGPFKSFAEMRQCDDPPNDEILEKCVSFALEAGFIPPEEAEMVRKTGGKGPGGCRGRDQCEAYCEDPANQELCFKFAEEHGLLSEEDREMMREGVEQMKEAMEDAPPEVAECIREEIPELDAILSGDRFPSPALGEKMRTCFEDFYMSEGGEFGEGGGMPPREFGGEGDEDFGGPPQGGENGFRGGAMPQFPPEVKACITEQLGEEFFKTFGRKRPSAEAERVMRECFAAQHQGGGDEGASGGGFGGDDGNREDFGGPPEGDFGGGFGKEKDRPCPAMSTVSECGPDEDMVGQEVPGCGFYGRCVPKGDSVRGGEGADIRTEPPAGTAPQEFKKEYQRQYQEEFQKQFEQEVERQYREQYQQEVERRTRERLQEGGGQFPPPPGLEGGMPTSLYGGPDTSLIGGVWEALRQLRGSP